MERLRYYYQLSNEKQDLVEENRSCRGTATSGPAEYTVRPEQECLRDACVTLAGRLVFTGPGQGGGGEGMDIEQFLSDRKQ